MKRVFWKSNTVLPNALRSLVNFDRLVEGALGGGLGGAGDRQALLRQLVHQIGEALAFLAEAVGDRHADVVEEQLGRVGCECRPILSRLRPAHKALAVGLDEDQRDALGAELRVGLGDDDDEVGVLAVGDVGLASR